jgi:uncharacterized protein YlxW (UPF0749 family)
VRQVQTVRTVSMLLAALVLGLLVSLRWSADATYSESSLGQVSRTIRQLELEQEDLKQSVGRLRQKLNSRQQDSAASTVRLEELRRELAKQKMRAGLVDVRGPGVRVILNDASQGSTGDASELLVHDFDLRDVIGVMWLAGAEAVSVNGERIVSSTSVYCVGSTIMVNDTRLSPPYEVSAIGDPVRLLDTFWNPGYLAELKMRSKRLGLQFEPIGVESLTVPAYRGSLPQKYAQPGS